MPAEVETRIHDAQAQVRRITLKMRDSGTDAVIVVVADTPLNRRAVAAAAPMLSGTFPVTARKALAALAEGRYPGARACCSSERSQPSEPSPPSGACETGTPRSPSRR